jgi:hypothetical protein
MLRASLRINPLRVRVDYLHLIAGPNKTLCPSEVKEILPAPLVITGYSKIAEMISYDECLLHQLLTDRVPPPKKLIHTICITKWAV